MLAPQEYIERVYAGVLGKIIGVYLGRPIEGWTHERIVAELGEITYFVNDRLNLPLVVTDDDLAGTFTFLRALANYGYDPSITPAQIGRTWLNYLIEGRTVLWWGGLGRSTEHTAYLRLKAGVPAPRSGSIRLNGRIIAEQIGAQIFIDGWGMVAPGDPELAADLARRAASVSHDGVAVHAAQVIAAMESLAFVEPDIQRLIDTALGLIPKRSLIRRLVHDIREWHVLDGDWRATRRRIAQRYGYETYRGACHVVPNHALIVLSLLYGEDDFGKTLSIVNSCGWDTDCNSGNVGCLMGIKNGLAGIGSSPDWRGPIADRLYLPTADGGRAITDAVIETYHIVNTGRALHGLDRLQPKQGARFHFELPGSVQGFQIEPPHRKEAQVRIENVLGHSVSGGRSLAIRLADGAMGAPVCILSPTFIPPEAKAMPGYSLLASPTLYSGQIAHARVEADARNGAPMMCGLIIRVYASDDALIEILGPSHRVLPGAGQDYRWQIPDTQSQPIAAIGLRIEAEASGPLSLYLDELGWHGTPKVSIAPQVGSGTMWKRAWVDGVDRFEAVPPRAYRVIHNHGTGLVMQGTGDWKDYVAKTAAAADLARGFGLAVRVQGLRRYYALVLRRPSWACLLRVIDSEAILAECHCPWVYGQTHALELAVEGNHLLASIDGKVVLQAVDEAGHLNSGGIAMLCEEGCAVFGPVEIGPMPDEKASR